MALADAVQGARYIAQIITWTDTENEPVDLSGATITGRIRSIPSNAASNIAGTIQVTDGQAGIFMWSYGATDVAAAGNYLVQFVATYPNALQDKTIAERWSVHEAL